MNLNSGNRNPLLVTFCLILLLSVATGGSAEVVTLANPNASNTAGGVAVDVEGYVYSADFGGTNLFKISPDGSEVTVFATGFNTPSGNNFDSQGNLFQSNFQDPNNNGAPDTISRITPEGIHTTFVDGLNGPVGVTLDGSDTLFVAMCNSNNVTKITQDLEVSVFASSSLFQCPNGITFDDRGILYVVNFNDGAVLRITPTGEVSLFATVPGGGNGHVVFVAGHLYVAARNAHQIYRVSTLDATVELVAGTGVAGSADGVNTEAQFNLPNGIARNREGTRLYTNGFGGIVRELTVQLPRPAAPTDLTAKLVGAENNRVRLVWSENAHHEEGYEVWMKIPGVFPWAVVDIRPVNKRVARIRRLEPGTTYLFKVRAINGTSVSGWSNTVRVKTPD